MSTEIARTGSQEARYAQSDPRRWRALAVLGLIPFMLVLDVTAGGLLVLALLERVSAEARNPAAELRVDPAPTNSEESFAGER
jgi:hypothetical protein